MAEKTFDELLSGAQTIRDNELPESNTHTLVGEQLVYMVEKSKEESEKKLAISDLASGRGESTITAMTQAAVTQELVAQDEKLTELSSLSNFLDLSSDINSEWKEVFSKTVKIKKGSELKLSYNFDSLSGNGWAVYFNETGGSEKQLFRGTSLDDKNGTKYAVASTDVRKIILYAQGSGHADVKLEDVTDTKYIDESVDKLSKKIIYFENSLEVKGTISESFSEVDRVKTFIRRGTFLKCTYSFNKLTGAGFRVYANITGTTALFVIDNVLDSDGVTYGASTEDINELIIYAQGSGEYNLVIEEEKTSTIELNGITKSSFSSVKNMGISTIETGTKLKIEYDFDTIGTSGWVIYANETGGAEKQLFRRFDKKGVGVAVASTDISRLILYAQNQSTENGIANVKITILDSSSPYCGKIGAILGDSHAINRQKWAPKIFNAIGAIYDEEISKIAIGEANSCGEGYEQYGDVFYCQALRAVEMYKSGKQIDLIIAENVHYQTTDTINDAFPLKVKNVIDLGRISTANINTWFNENISDILTGKEPTLGTIAFVEYSNTQYKLTFTGTPSAGECAVIVDGHTFNATLDGSETLEKAVEKLGIWSFGDYTDWKNSVSSNVITLTYKGSETEIPIPSISFTKGTTGLSMAQSSASSYSKLVKYFESYSTSDWLNYEKWKTVTSWFGYSGLKGFYETLLEGIPGVTIVCVAFPCYGIKSGEYQTGLGANMKEFYESSFYKNNRQRALTFMQAGEYYNAKVIDVEKLCGITLNNWFEYNPSGDVHPKDNGYDRWADTVINNLI